MTTRLLCVSLLCLVACRLDGDAPLRGNLHGEALAAWAASSPYGARRVSPVLGPPVPARHVTQHASVPRVIGDDTLHAVQFSGTSLAEAFLHVAALGGLNLALVGDFSQPVELALPAVSLQAAFELLVTHHGCAVEASADTVVVRRVDPGGRITRVFPLQSVPAALAREELAEMLGEDGRVVASPSRDVLLVTASVPLMQDVVAYLQAIDRPDRQIILEARILEVSRDELQEVGVQMAFNDVGDDDDVAHFAASLLTSSTQVLASFADGAGELDFAINALRTWNALDILARPRVLALDGRVARLEIVTEVPYVQATTITEINASVGSQTVEAVEFKHIGLVLEVVPTIQQDGLVSLAIDQHVSEQTGVFKDIPVVDSRVIQTEVLVEDGQTIMIGGLQRTRSERTTTGVPILMDLPLLGAAFRSEVEQRRATELVVLMTPRLVDPRKPLRGSAESHSLGDGMLATR